MKLALTHMWHNAEEIKDKQWRNDTWQEVFVSLHFNLDLVIRSDPNAIIKSLGLITNDEIYHPKPIYQFFDIEPRYKFFMDLYNREQEHSQHAIENYRNTMSRYAWDSFVHIPVELYEAKKRLHFVMECFNQVEQETKKIDIIVFGMKSWR